MIEASLLKPRRATSIVCLKPGEAERQNSAFLAAVRSRTQLQKPVGGEPLAQLVPHLRHQLLRAALGRQGLLERQGLSFQTMLVRSRFSARCQRSQALCIRGGLVLFLSLFDARSAIFSPGVERLFARLRGSSLSTARAEAEAREVEGDRGNFGCLLFKPTFFPQGRLSLRPILDLASHFLTSSLSGPRQAKLGDAFRTALRSDAVPVLPGPAKASTIAWQSLARPMWEPRA